MSDGRRLASNAGYLGALTVSNYLLGLLIFPYLSRVLSLDAFGLLGFSMAFVVIFQVVVEYGFMISSTAEISHRRAEPTEIGRVVSTVMLAKALLLVIAASGFVVTALLIPMVRDHVIVVGLFLVSAVVTAFIPDFYFRGVERMRSIAIRAVASKAIALLLIVLIVKGDDQLPLVPIALAIGSAVAVFFGFLVINRDGIVLPRPRFRDSLKSLRDGAGFFASRVAASVNQSAGALVLGLQFTPTSAAMAQFAGASRVASAGELAVIPISDAIYPHMIRTRDYRLFWRVYLMGLSVWLAGCTVVFVWAEPICAILLGKSFAPAGALLRILVVGVFIAYSSNLFGYAALSPLGLARHANYALLLGASVTVFAFLGLWFFDLITPATVCVALVLSQLAIFLYRFLTFITHRPKAGSVVELS